MLILLNFIAARFGMIKLSVNRGGFFQSICSPTNLLVKPTFTDSQILNFIRKEHATIAVAIFWLCLSTSPQALADSRKPKIEETFFNPLEIKTPDPLLPNPNLPLTPLQRLKLKAALDELDRQAAARYAVGDRNSAFAIWNRELRLRRALGFQEELQALSRVGGIAWQDNQRPDLQVITQRLQTIGQQIQSQPNVNLQLLRSLGLAFQQVREPDNAIAIYNRILVTARQQRDVATIQATLKTLAELNLSWFDYAKAATAYEELLSFATEVGDRLGVLTNLQQLDFIYGQARRYQQAIAVKQKLFEIYQNDPQLSLSLPALRLAIAKDYLALGQIQTAFENFQQAYTSAWPLQQYSLAGDALRQLIALYRSQNQIDAALQTSQILLQAEQFASDFYGMMTAYDQIGQIYLNLGDKSEALAAFQKGLELAQQLNYQETYFAGQIKEINQPSQ